MEKRWIIGIVLLYCISFALGGFLGYTINNYGNEKSKEDDIALCTPSGIPVSSFNYSDILVNYEIKLKKDNLIRVLDMIDKDILNRDYFNNLTFFADSCLCDGISCRNLTGQYHNRTIQAWYYNELSFTTVYHEIGHAVWIHNLNILQKYRWCQLYRKYNSTEQIRNLGKIDCEENFADYVRYYYFMPDLLIKEKKEVLEGMIWK